MTTDMMIRALLEGSEYANQDGVTYRLKDGVLECRWGGDWEKSTVGFNALLGMKLVNKSFNLSYKQAMERVKKGEIVQRQDTLDKYAYKYDGYRGKMRWYYYYANFKSWQYEDEYTTCLPHVNKWRVVEPTTIDKNYFDE